MATFSSGFIRPGVYVKQTVGQGAPQLPTTFVSAFMGHGSDRYSVSDQELSSDGELLQSLDSNRNAASITGIKINNIAVATNRYSLENSGSLPFGTASIRWNTGQAPAAGTKYYVTYVAYKNPSIDFDVQFMTSFDAHLAFYGAPSQSANVVVSGDYIKNSLSMGAYISEVNGAATWYGAQLNSFDNTTFGATMACGTSVGATGPVGSTGTSLVLNVNGDGAKTVAVAAGLTGVTMAAALQAAVRSLTASNSALQAAYDQFTVVFASDRFTLTSGMVGSSSAVVVTAGVLAEDLGLGVVAGGVETAGSGPTLLDLTSEAGLQTSAQQVLAKLELIDAYVVVPFFPIVSGGINTAMLAIMKAHVDDMRSITAQKWRVAVMGALKNSDTGSNPETKYIAAATALGTSALAYVAPSTTKFVYGGLEYTLSGWSVAAAVAGIMTNPLYGGGEPIAGKGLVGFSEIKDTFNVPQKNLMGTAGVLMIDSELGTPAIIMDLTTDQSNAVASQLKFTRAADYVAKSLRLILRKLYINVNNLGDTTMGNIGSTTKMILQQMAWLHIINDFEDPKVSRNTIDPRQVDLVVAIQLVPDVSWIYVNLGVNL